MLLVFLFWFPVVGVAIPKRPIRSLIGCLIATLGAMLNGLFLFYHKLSYYKLPGSVPSGPVGLTKVSVWIYRRVGNRSISCGIRPDNQSYDS